MRNLCKCGCGRQVATEGSKFLRGHHVKDVPKSPEHRAKLSAAKLGKKLGPQSEAHRRKIGDALRGKKLGPQTLAHKNKIIEIKRLNRLRRLEKEREVVS